MSVVKLTNEVVIPLHWDDRNYIADCAECGVEVSAPTTNEIKLQIEQHACVSL